MRINVSNLQTNDSTTAVKKGKTIKKSKDRKSSVISSIDLSLDVYLGSAKLSVAELKELEENSVLELESSLNQSVELKLNGVSIAQGELVAVGDKFGVRITNLAQ